MKETTLGYIECRGHYLMLYRNKKNADPSKGKWIGVGGHLEDGESPDACFLREVLEETGITLKEVSKIGEVLYYSDTWDDEKMHLYVASVEDFQISECEEGTLRWIPKEEVLALNTWEGDKYFLSKLLNGESGISLILEYEGEKLVKVEEVSKKEDGE